MFTVTSFKASDVPPEELTGLIAGYLWLDQIRAFRRLLVRRCGLFSLGIALAGPGLRWLPTFASWFVIGVSLLVPAWAWLYELRSERQLALRLKALPGPVREVPPRSAVAFENKKVIKSS